MFDSLSKAALETLFFIFFPMIQLVFLLWTMGKDELSKARFSFQLCCMYSKFKLNCVDWLLNLVSLLFLHKTRLGYGTLEKEKIWTKVVVEIFGNWDYIYSHEHSYWLGLSGIVDVEREGFLFILYAHLAFPPP